MSNLQNILRRAQDLGTIAGKIVKSETVFVKWLAISRREILARPRHVVSHYRESTLRYSEDNFTINRKMFCTLGLWIAGWQKIRRQTRRLRRRRARGIRTTTTPASKKHRRMSAKVTRRRPCPQRPGTDKTDSRRQSIVSPTKQR